MGHCLILISCSNHKRADGGEEYFPEDSILRMLNNETRKNVLNQRQEIFNLIKNRQIEDLLRYGGNRADDPNNHDLRNGPDISTEENEINSLYMPAYRRYFGRFFKEAGIDVFEKAISQ